MHKIAFIFTVVLLFGIFLQNSLEVKRRKHKYRHHSRYYDLTFSIRNHNITEAKFFQIRGPGHTAYFRVPPGEVFTKTFKVRGKGNWVLFVEFGGNYYAKSRPKIISRDSFPHWFMELYSYSKTDFKKNDIKTDIELPDAVGFTDWEKVTEVLEEKLH